MNLSWLLPNRRGVPVLMYHRVWPGMADGLTISPEALHSHWGYMRDKGYEPLALSEYLDIVTGKAPFRENAVLLTFDDGCRNNLEYVYPLLQEMGWCATFFIVANTLDGAKEPLASEQEVKMTLAELRQLDPAVVQLALHGYAHENMRDLGVERSVEVLRQSMGAFDRSGLTYYKVLAYPYGARPTNEMPELKRVMAEMGIVAAFRIGNSISPAPADDTYELKRIDVKGTDTTEDLQIKLKKGKLKPF